MLWNVDNLYVVLIQCIEVFYVFTCMEYCAFIVAIFRIPSLEFSQASLGAVHTSVVLLPSLSLSRVDMKVVTATPACIIVSIYYQCINTIHYNSLRCGQTIN